MRLVFLSFFIIFSFQTIWAQQPKKYENSLNNARFKLGFPAKSVVNGSPYLDSTFVLGTVVKMNKDKFNNVLLRYNIYSQTMEFLDNKTVLQIADPENVVRVIMKNTVFIYARYKSSDKITLTWFQLLTEDKYQLLKKYSTKLSGTSDNPALAKSPMTFEPSPPEYYIRYRDGMAFPISSKKKLIKALQPVSENIVENIQNTSINLKDENQLISLIKFINKSAN